MKFCQFVASLYSRMPANFDRFVLIFNKMALIFLGVLIIFTISSFDLQQVRLPTMQPVHTLLLLDKKISCHRDSADRRLLNRLASSKVIDFDTIYQFLYSDPGVDYFQNLIMIKRLSVISVMVTR